MDNNAQVLVTVLSSLGVGGLLSVIAQAIAKRITGAGERERLRNTDIRVQLSEALRDKDAADERADREAMKRRKFAEALSAARRQLIEAGLNPGAWPGENERNERER